MKLSELIELLQKTIEEHGDIEVEAAIPYSPGGDEPQIHVHRGAAFISGEK